MGLEKPGYKMTDEQIERFMELFRKYRNDGKLPEGEREEFRELASLWSGRGGCMPGLNE